VLCKELKVAVEFRVNITLDYHMTGPVFQFRDTGRLEEFRVSYRIYI
jgi:hypothetical protein